MMQINGGEDMDINLLSTEDIRFRQSEIKAASIKAYELGFHGVEYHCAHGYALCKFVDARYNERTDEFSGDIEGRTRIITSILGDVRQSTSDEFILSVRMGEYLPTSKNGLDTARHFEAAGIDMLNISFGMEYPTAPVPEDFPFSPVTYSGYVVKQAVKIPVIGLDEIRDRAQARMLAEKGYADIVGIGRGLLADPHFARHVLNDSPVAQCYGCEECKWFSDHRKCPGRMPRR
jgi:2,4-dienoyl-CoA reductase-like NADH-dependent reductase (Old Yellow Enzyme family)